jgi:hypothetical protein
MRLDTEARCQRAETLGNGPMSSLSIHQDADDQTNDEDASAGAVEGDGRPMRNHVFGHGNEHQPILADITTNVATATVGQPF